MDDKDKSIFETVTDSIKNTINIATEAAKHAMEPAPLKPDEEVVVIPATGAPDLVNPMPPMYAVVKKRRSVSKQVAKAAKVTKAKKSKGATTSKKTSKKKTTIKAPKTSAKKSTKKVTKKKTAPTKTKKKSKKSKR